jgi:mannosyltransferase OCH1-like enzyme
MVKIPQIIHKIFINHTNSFSPQHDDDMRSLIAWVRLNPSYRILTWNQHDCRKMISDNFSDKVLSAYDKCKPYAYKSDLARYCIIYLFGGWYSDWKQMPKFSIESTFDTFKDIVFVHDLIASHIFHEFCYTNNFFGCVPKHPVLEKTIRSVVNNIHTEFYGESTLSITFRPFSSHVRDFYKSSYDGVFKMKKHIDDEGEEWISTIIINKDFATFLQHREFGRENEGFINGNKYDDLWHTRDVYHQDR